MVEKIYNLVEILDRDVVKNGDGITPFQFKLSYSDGKTVDLKDKRVYVSFASTNTYLFKKKAEVDSEGVISITLNDADPIIEGNTEIEISVESSNGKSQKFPSQDGEHSAFVYISKSIESLNSRVISTYTLKQFSDKIDILMDDLDQKYDTHLGNLKKDVGDYIDNSVEDSVEEIKAVAKESMDASIKASEESIAASHLAEKNIKDVATKATTDVNNTASKANMDINKVATDAKNNVNTSANTATTNINNTSTKATTDINTAVVNGKKEIVDTSNTAVATVDVKTKEVLDVIKNNEVALKKDTFTNVDGKGFSRSLPAGTTDWYQISTAGNYSVTKTAVPTNAPPIGVYFNLIVNTRTSTTRDLTAVNVTTGAIHTNAMTSDGWSGWNRVAFEKEAQISKITADNGAPKYDLPSDKNLFIEASKWGNGLHTFYLSAGATNNPAGALSYVTGSAYFYGNSGGITAFDKTGRQYYAARTGATTFTDWQDFASYAALNGVSNRLNGEIDAMKSTSTGWVTLPLLNGVVASTPVMYRFYSANGINLLSFKGAFSTISSRDVVVGKLPDSVASKIDRVLTFVANTSVSSNTARVNRWSVEMNGDVKFTASSFSADGSSGAWNPLDVTLTL